LVVDRFGNIARLKQTFGTPQLDLGELKLSRSGFNLREILYLEGLAITDAEPRLRLTEIRERLISIRIRLIHGLPLLFDLCAGLIDTDLAVTRIEPDEHVALIHVGSDVEIHLDYLPCYVRGYIRLSIARKAAGRLNVSRDRHDHGRRGCNIDDLRLTIRVTCVRGSAAAAPAGYQDHEKSCRKRRG
jgi:hypothetical protein